jgi:hypothetical protein
LPAAKGKPTAVAKKKPVTSKEEVKEEEDLPIVT